MNDANDNEPLACICWAKRFCNFVLSTRVTVVTLVTPGIDFPTRKTGVFYIMCGKSVNGLAEAGQTTDAITYPMLICLKGGGDADQATHKR